MCAGKTTFGHELLRHYHAANHTIVYENQELQSRWLLPSGDAAVWRGSLDAFGTELEQATTVYICDCGKDSTRSPTRCDALTIVLSSPNAQHYRGWLSEERMIRRLYMPLWSLAEVRAVVPAIYPSRQTDKRDDNGDVVLDPATHAPMRVDLYEQRLHIFNGAARFVFSPNDDDVLLQTLSDRLTSCDLAQVIATASSNLTVVLPVQDVTWRFVRIDVEQANAAGQPTFDRISLDFVSDHILGRLVTRQRQEHRTQLAQLLKESGGGADDSASLRGKVFERYALNELSKGGDFRARWCDRRDLSEMVLQFPATQQVGVQNALHNLGAGVSVGAAAR
jgi:hypothetical protein